MSFVFKNPVIRSFQMTQALILINHDEDYPIDRNIVSCQPHGLNLRFYIYSW